MARKTSKNDFGPKVWVGHIELGISRRNETEEFMRNVGMRPVFKGEKYAVPELRGGTHLVLSAKKRVIPKEAAFDLMVEDLEATREKCEGVGLFPSPIKAGGVHRWFYLKEPSGYRIQVISSHVGSRRV